MNFHLLFILTEDPRISHRPAEAVRIAAGLATGKRITIALYLADLTLLALSKQIDQLIDEDHFVRYLPLLAQEKAMLYVEKNAPSLAQLQEPSCPYQEIDPAQLAQLTAQTHHVIRF